MVELRQLAKLGLLCLDAARLWHNILVNLLDVTVFHIFLSGESLDIIKVLFFIDLVFDGIRVVIAP